MTAKKNQSAAKPAADLKQGKKVTVLVLSPLRGKYKLPYTAGHVISLNENVAKELVDAKDAEYFDEKALKKAAKEAEETSETTEEIENTEVTDPTQV
jgi:hypothetical protein